MSRLPEICVIDASVGIKLFLNEEGSEEVRELFEDRLVRAGSGMFVPDLFFIECANILWKRVARGELPVDAATGHLADLADLAPEATPTYDLMQRALEIASAHNITAYDACYVALAEMKDVPLLTADERLAQRLGGGQHEVIVLGH